MYLVIAIKVLMSWFFGYKLPTRIVQKKYLHDGKIRVWPYWLFFFIQLVMDEVIDIFIGYMMLNLTIDDFLYGTPSMWNDFTPILYVIVSIVAGSHRQNACVPKSDSKE